MSWKSTWSYTKEVYNKDDELAHKAEADIFREFDSTDMTETALGKPSD